MKHLSDFNWKNKIAVIRTDFNVPLNNDRDITDDTRIREGIPTILRVLQEGGGVVCLSHLGRPQEGFFNPNLGLQPIKTRLVKLLNEPHPNQPIPVRLEKLESIEENIAQTKPAVGNVLLIENTRFNIGEKQNSINLAKRYSALGDVFVMDAFATAHRSEASTCALAEVMPSCAGLLLSAEIDALKTALHKPAKPLVAIVGGAKISTKLNALKHLLPLCDTLIVGGGIANHFIKAGGHQIGASLMEPSLIDETVKLSQQYGGKIAAIKDVVVVDDNNKKRTTTLNNIGQTEKILDVGKQTQTDNASIVSNAGTIIWSGPIGVFETPDFAAGTETLAHAIACSKAYSLAGGGDTLAAVTKFGIKEYDNGISYLSTGGGAFLQFLEGTPLPSIQALMDER